MTDNDHSASTPDRESKNAEPAIRLDALVQEGLRAHQSGNLEAAEALYRKVLSVDPDHADANHFLGVIAYQAGKPEESHDLIARAIGANPGNAAYHCNLGNALSELGRLDEAAASLGQAIALNPEYAKAHNNLGNVLLAQGRIDDAVASYHEALSIAPGNADTHANLGTALHQQGHWDEAAASYHEALALNPDYAEAHTSLGNTLQKTDRLEEAIASHRKALVLKPDFAEAHSNLGNAFRELGKLEDAAASYHEAVALKPDYAEAHGNLGHVFRDLGKLDDAAASYRKALALKPDDAEAQYNLGITLHDLGKVEEAEPCFHQAIVLKPDFAEAHHNLGVALQDLGKVDEAVPCYQKAVALKPDFAGAHKNLANALRDLGDVNGAVEHINLALSHEPDKDGWRINKALLLPVIPSSQEDIQTHRDALAKAVTALTNQNLTVSNLVSDVGSANFYLAYHGLNNRSLMRDIAEMYIAACPKLTYEAKHCRSGRKEEKDVLRIGFLSSYLQNHTVGKLTRGIIENFSRELFEVIVFRPPGKKDHISGVIDRAADKVVSLHKELERDWKIIEKEELDILFYLDIGMDPYTYFLSFARLAPVQAVSWGHPDTTGIPNIDYFISSEHLEIPDAASHYTEQLIRLPNLPTYYFRPEVPEKKFDHGDFGLPDEGRFYVCPQPLFKFHPQFDDILGELLRRDPDGRLVLIDDKVGGYWKRLLCERFNRAFPDVVDHVIFVPQMPHEKYLGLLTLADALLDIPTFSGGNSSLEAFAVSAPIVTWPQDFMRSRVTAAFYKQMGLNELIATDGESYLATALRLAQDVDFKRRMQTEINANAHKLYERHESVREMETFFNAAYEAWRTGEILTKSSFRPHP